MNSAEEDEEERTATASSWLFPVEPVVEIEESNESLEIDLSDEEQMDGWPSNFGEDNGLQVVRELESELVDKMCEICGNFFKTFELVNPEAKKPLLSTCETCSYYITPPVTSMYSSSNTNTFSCAECSKTFVRKDKLLRHMNTHSKDKLYSCDMCDKSYKRRDKLTKHINLTHLGVNRFIKNACVTCGTERNIITMNVGENEAEFIKLCEACNRSRQEQLNYQSRKGSNGFPCDLCSKLFSRKEHVARHRLSHLNVKPFKCSLCKKSFSRSDRLQRHMRLHPEAKRFSCKVCSSKFANREELKSHYSTHQEKNGHVLQKHQTSLLEELLTRRYTRGEVNLFKCNSCGLKFKNKGALNDHSLTHSNAETYSCHLCDKVFKQKYKLKIHHLAHIDTKPYACDYCDSVFKYQNKLSYHLKSVHSKVSLNCVDQVKSVEIICLV